jgi:Tfp pilus assembly protein PilZ
MNLPTDLFDQITSSVNVVSRDEPRPGAADRRSPRVKLSSHLSLAMWSDPADPLSVRIRDFSAGGVGLFHSERIALDEQVVVRLPLQNNQNVLVLGTVVYWEPLAEKLFGIGVQFERIVEESEITEQSEQSIRQQVHQIGVVSRFAQAFARTWRIAS